MASRFAQGLNSASLRVASHSWNNTFSSRPEFGRGAFLVHPLLDSRVVVVVVEHVVVVFVDCCYLQWRKKKALRPRHPFELSVYE